MTRSVIVIVREGGRPSNRRHRSLCSNVTDYWMPAYAGMTVKRK